MVLPLAVLRASIGSGLITFGLYRLWRHRHPRFGGMQVGFRDLAVWSFLMASAHGAGLMVLPFVMVMSGSVLAASGDHGCHTAVPAGDLSWNAAMALGVHALAYFGVMTLAAWVVYRKLGLALLAPRGSTSIGCGPAR